MLQGVHKHSEYSYSPKMVSIAPAPMRQCIMDNTDMPEKKYNYKTTGYNGAQAASIARRNARERNRVKQVNDGFNALRKRLPASVIAALSGGSRRGSGKKLSKVDTLRMVVEYIRYLQSLIEESDAAAGFTKPLENPMEADEGIFGGSSPYSESVPSPSGSECSSGVSSAHSSSYIPYQQEQFSVMEEDELLDAITWWQQK